MARAINDINLCREILAGAIRMTIILFMMRQWELVICSLIQSN